MPAKRGRPPKPTALKRLHNAGRRPVNELEPEPPAVTAATEICSTVVLRIDPPVELSPRGQQRWRELAADLANMRVLTKVDLAEFAMYCDAYGDWHRLVDLHNEVLNKSAAGAFLEKTPNGMLQMGALFLAKSKARMDAHKLGAGFGLNPAARTSIKTEKPQETSGWEEFV